MSLRVLVIGGMGMLGHKLCQQLPTLGCSVIATVRSSFDPRTRYPGVFDACDIVTNVDVLDSASLYHHLQRIAPQVVVNCVGVIKQKSAAADRYQSTGINSFLPHQLARWCGELSSRLIHISTDCVFDGTQGGYRESDPCTATDLYGQSKSLGETEETEPAAITLRTSIIGRELSESGHGLLEWFLQQRGGHARGFRHAIYSGVTTHELARVIARVATEFPALNGVYQVVGQTISKFELLQLANAAFGNPVQMSEETTFRCDRSMIGEKFAAATGYSSPDWATLLSEIAHDKTPYDDWHKNARELEAKWRTHAFKSC